MAEKPEDRVGRIIDIAAARKDADAIAWLGRLDKNAQGGWHSTLANALLIMENDPPLSGLFGFNAFTHQFLVMRAPPVPDRGAPEMMGPYPRVWEIPDVALVQAHLQRVWTPKFGRETTEQSMLTVAAQHQFHPVRDWLNTLKWDGIARLNTWLKSTFGCPDDDYHAAIGSRLIIAAVRRVRVPGCKFDHMIVFEGKQAIGKSSACRELFGPELFSDSIPSDLGSRDAALSLTGVWCIEFAEIDALLRNETETIKAFLSRQTDRYRPPYGRAVIERPRQCVLVGTTNSDDYLRDTTGNRRIWPVKCKHVELDWLKNNRKQLWAEAAAREKSGESIWLHEHEIAAIAANVQAERLPEDVWADKIQPWLSGRIEVRVAQVLGECLQIPAERQGRREQMRVAAILRRIGLTLTKVREGKITQNVWLIEGS